MASDANSTQTLIEHDGPGENMVLVGQGVPSPAGMSWYGGAPAQPEILTAGVDPVWLLHSLRRRWILAAGLGLLAGLLVSGLAWILIPSTASARAYLKVASVKPSIAFRVDEGGEADFETYRRTLLALFKTQPVLQAALRKPGLSELSMIRDEPEEMKVEWLRSNLEVQFPDKSELLEVLMEGESAQDIVAFVNATTDAFLEEVINKDNVQRRGTLDALQRSYQKTISEIEKKRQQFNELARELNTSESQEANVDRGIFFSELTLVRQEQERVGRDLFIEETKTSQLQAKQRDPLLIKAQIESQLSEDPQIQVLSQQLTFLEVSITEEQARAKRPDAPSIVRLKERRQSMARRMAERQKELRPRMRFDLENNPNIEITSALKESEIHQKYLVKRREKLQERNIAITTEIKRLGERSLELGTIESELKQLEKIASSMGNKIESWQIELDSPDRVTQVQRAELTPGLNRFQRYILIGMGGMFGLGFTCLGIAFWDFGSRRLNGSQQVDEGLSLRVIGELPPLAGSLGKSDSDPAVAALKEAIDGVRTTLIHAGSTKPAQVIMVTGARGHEGSTTVASLLAASLARAGRRTLLVDGDMRHPGLHRIFSMPLEDGLCDVLRAEAEIADTARPTEADNLYVMTAGICDASSIQALARDQIQPILDTLREKFEFVIIDGAPLLDLADSLIIGQHTDGAVLSVLRDVSRVPEIHQARERLNSVGIRVLGSVVNGVHKPANDRSYLPLLTEPVEA